MSITQQDKMMMFDFVDNNDQRERLLFIEPEKMVTAYSTDEVLKAMEEIDQYINDGYYAAGYVSYEAGASFDNKLSVKSNNKMPLIYFGIYSKPINIYYQNTQKSEPFKKKLNWDLNVSEKEYKEKIEAIKQFISCGDTYQVNYTMRFTTDYSFDDISFYEQLLRAQNSKYSAYLNLGRFRILSVSPELFFNVTNGRIITRPMKGTIKRGRWFEEDIANRKELINSEKDQAENLMIVDLLRNDLSKIAKTGTVKVPKLFEVEKYPTVYQMTSTVTAELVDDITFKDIFKALFPCGSITGAPKASTMEIINELEDSPREVYCGSIGYITPEKKAIFNVAIRTVIIDTQIEKVYYGVGGGITWGSNSTSEYKEAITKAAVLHEEAPIFELMETIKYENQEFYLLDYHIERISKSANYFSIPFNKEKIFNYLTEYSDDLPKDGITRVNLYIDFQGHPRITSVPFEDTSDEKKVKLASSPISNNEKFLYHKTTNRKFYEKHQEFKGEMFDVLLWNEDLELTEFTIGNLVVKWMGNYWTPPIECGLLPGTFRAHLIREGKIKEKILPLQNLNDFEEIWFINSLRGWVRVNLQNG
jgi:para-aminobenzoate synthetase/4-amino-4-deoxychorismate lyase